MEELVAHLEALGEDGLVELLRARPELVGGQLHDLRSLAGFAQRSAALLPHLRRLDAFHLGVAEAVAACSPATADDVAQVLGIAAADRPALLAAVEALAAAAVVVVRADGRAQRTAGLAACFEGRPLRLGRAGRSLLRATTADVVRAAAPAWGVAGATKERLVEELLAAYADRARVEAVIATAPPPARRRFDELVAAGALEDLGRWHPDEAAVWLRGRLLAFPTPEGDLEVPRELGMAWRGLPLRRPSPSAPTVPGRAVAGGPDGLAAASAHAAVAVVDAVDRLLTALDRQPAAMLRSASGGVGARELKRLAAEAEVAEEHVGALLEVAAGAGLLGLLVHQPPKRGRREPERTLSVGLRPAADRWWGASVGQRWAALVEGWLELRTCASEAGGRAVDGKAIAALDHRRERHEVPALRRLVLGIVAAVGPGEGADPDDVRRAATWRQPLLLDVDDVVDATLADARLLGVVVEGAVPAHARRLLEGWGDDDRQGAAAALDALVPPPGDRVVLQADLTAVAPGPLVPELARRLDGMATVASRGHATVWRFDEASVRRALDAGATADELLQLLAAHAAKGVPQALEVLVRDTARRHGGLQVAPASAVVVGDDEALVAEVVRSRKLAKLGLRQVAPTVLVTSTAAAPAVVAALRAAGHLPVPVAADGTVRLTGPSSARAGLPLRREDVDGELRLWVREQVDPVQVARRLLHADRHRREREAPSPELPAPPPPPGPGARPALRLLEGG